MKTLMVIHDGDEHRCRIFDEDLSRFDGAGIGTNDLGEEIFPLIFNDGYIHDDWAVDADCTALINAKEWDVMIFVEDYS